MVNKCGMCGVNSVTLSDLCRSCYIDVAVTEARNAAEASFDSMLDNLSDEASIV